MTKRLNSKHKVDRRLKVNLWGRPKSPFNTRAYGPGQHGQTKTSKPSDYGIQLQAKQKLKAYYGNINERQFRNIYRKALSKKGDTTENLIALLESRLDTVIYRAKFATTVFSARQMINHGMFLVNKKRITAKGFLLNPGDVVEVADIFWLRTFKNILKRLKKNTFFIPPPMYLEVDFKTLCGIFVRRPLINEIPYPVSMNFDLVKEFYRYSS